MELAIVVGADFENPTVGDLLLVNGTLVFTSDLGLEVAQRLLTRLNFFKGEWFFDRRQGVPYYQQLLVKGVDSAVVRSVFTQVITGTKGVANLTNLTIGEPDANRESQIVFACLLTNGQRFKSTDYGAFIVRVP